MDEKYLELVRNQLIAYDPTYKDISLQQFTKDMQEDSGYSRQVFNYLKESDNGKPDKVVVDVDFTQFSNRVKTNSDIDGAAGVSEQGVGRVSGVSGAGFSYSMIEKPGTTGTTGATGTIGDETTTGITGVVGTEGPLSEYQTWEQKKEDERKEPKKSPLINDKGHIKYDLFNARREGSVKDDLKDIYKDFDFETDIGDGDLIRFKHVNEGRWNEVKLNTSWNAWGSGSISPDKRSGESAYNHLINNIEAARKRSIERQSKEQKTIYQLSGIESGEYGEYNERSYDINIIPKEFYGTYINHPTSFHFTNTQEKLGADPFLTTKANDEQVENIVKTLESSAFNAAIDHLDDILNFSSFAEEIAYNPFTEGNLTPEQNEKFWKNIYDNLFSNLNEEYTLTKAGFNDIVNNPEFKNNLEQRIREIANAKKYNFARNQTGELSATEFFKNSELNNDILSGDKNTKDLYFLQKQLQKTESKINALETNPNKSGTQQEELENLIIERNKILFSAERLSGGAWDHGTWTDNYNIDETSKSELTELEGAAWNEAANILAKIQDSDAQTKLSQQNLVKYLYDKTIFYKEALVNKGNKSTFKIDLNYMNQHFRDRKQWNEFNSLLKSSSLNLNTSVKGGLTPGDPLGIINDDTGELMKNIELSYNDIFNFGTRITGYSGGIDEMLKTQKDKEVDNYRIWEKEYLANEAVKKGYFRVGFLGIDPRKVEKGGFFNVFGRSMLEAGLNQWGGMNEEEIKETLGEDFRDVLSDIETTMYKINASKPIVEGDIPELDLTYEQLESFKIGISEMTASATGGFVPTLTEWIAFDVATGGLGITTQIASMSNKFWRFAAGALKEEVKMQATTADFGVGTGVMFYSFGSILNKLKFFPKHQKQLNELTQKYITGGIAGASSLEASEIVHGVVNDLMGEKDWSDTLEELYGSEDESFKRVISNTLMFMMTGAAHADPKKDFAGGLTNKSRIRAVVRLKDLQVENIKKARKLTNTPDPSYKAPGELKGQKVDPGKLYKDLVKLAEGKGNKSKEAQGLLQKIILNDQTQNLINSRMSVSAQVNSLDPFKRNVETGKYEINEQGEKELNPYFEENFNKKVMDPFNATMRKQMVNSKGETTYKAPEIVYGRGESFRLEFDEVNNVAQFTPNKDGGKILVDLDRYEPGKEIHELTHVVFHHYFKNNPSAKNNIEKGFNKLYNETKDLTFNHGKYGRVSGEKLMEVIKTEYKTEDKAVTGEEYVAWLTELLADPQVYATNPHLASSAVKEAMSKIRLIKKSYGLGTKDIKTSADLVRTLGEMHEEMRTGGPSKISIESLVSIPKKLENISTTEYEIMPDMDLADRPLVTAASKEFTPEKLKRAEELSARTQEIYKETVQGKTGEDKLKAYNEMVSPNPAVVKAKVLEIVNENKELLKEKPEGYKEKIKANVEEISRIRQGEFDKILYGIVDRSSELLGGKKISPEDRERMKQALITDERGLLAILPKYNEKQPITKYVQNMLTTRFQEIYNREFPGYEEKGKRVDLEDVKDIITDERDIEINLVEALGKEEVIAEELIEPIKLIETVSKIENLEIAEDLTDRAITNIRERYDKLSKKEKENLTMKNLKDLSPETTAIVFGVPVKKLKPPNNISTIDTEAFLKRMNNEEFAQMVVDLMPEGAVPSTAGEDIRNTSTGIPKKVLEKIYELGKKGRIKNLNEYSKPEDLSIDDIMTAVGMVKKDGKWVKGPNFKPNSPEGQAIKGIMTTMGKMITNREVRLLKEERGEPMGPFTVADNILQGKSDRMASKDLADALSEIRKIGLTFDGEFDPNKIITKYGLTGWEAEAIAKLDIDQVKQAILDGNFRQEEINELRELDIEKDIAFFEGMKIEEIARKTNKSVDQLLEEIQRDIETSTDELRLESDLPKKSYKQISSKENVDKEGNLRLGKTHKYFLKGMIPKGENFMDLPIQAQKTIINALGFGDSGSSSIKLGERPLTYKEYQKELIEKLDKENRDITIDKKGKVKDANYKDLLEIVYGEEALIGIGEKIEGIEDVFSPSDWGKAGLAGRAEKIILNNKDFPTIASKREGIAKLLTQEGKTVDQTFEANKRLFKRGYEVLKDMYLENPTKETLEDIIDFLAGQTNRSTGLFKGLVNMESFTLDPAEGKGKKKKMLHNEHLIELFSITKDFVKGLDRVGNKKQALEDFEKELDQLLDDAGQALISKVKQEEKDFTGTSKRDWRNPLVFLGKDAERQIPISEKAFEEYETMAEVIRDGATKEFIKQVMDTPYNKLTPTGIIFKQRGLHENNYKQLKVENQQVANDATMASKDITNIEIITELSKRDKAFTLGNKIDKPVKKARIADFDDTLARSKSNVIYTMPDGKTGKLNAAQFAKRSEELESKGAKFDFSEFNKVIEGRKGPMFDLFEKLQKAEGERDLFVLTARSPEAAPAIKKFLDGLGLDIPIDNIVGLGNGAPRAKSDWIIDKASEGYNDFYFTDDHLPNVRAVRNALGQLDVKSKVQQALASKDLSENFNKILENTSGIKWYKEFSPVKARVVGEMNKKRKFFIPPSAEDFLGLLYSNIGKGKEGEAHLKFYDENLLKPYSRAIQNLSTDRVNLMQDFKELKKQLEIPKDLKKKNETNFTNEQAVRVYLWNKSGKEIPGLSKTDLKELNSVINNNPKLQAFADQILGITKGDGYSDPGKNWLTGTITTDLIDVLNTTKRGKYLETWEQNKNLIFSEANLNKLEAIHGKNYREALENTLTRMKSGKNRLAGGNRLSNQLLDYINGGVGTIMFMNTKSAVLQTISATNYINLSFNNPLKAGKAFANQKQYWKDWHYLMTSDYLKDRRQGLKLNISESEIADAAKSSGNKSKAVLNYFLQKGFLPTQIADSFAIASGGATFYRNRISDLMKNEKMSKKDAEKKAFGEFRELSELSQQSSDPSKISQQQSSDLGRVVLQFVNTPMQYTRMQKRAIQDIANGRGNNKENLSRIVYYGFMQNLWFNAMQQGVFALGFGDDEIDDKEEKKLVDTANGMADSMLRGIGFSGVTVSVLKNLGIDIYERSQKDRPEYSKAWETLLEFSPAIKSKLTKLKSAGWPADSKKRREEMFEKGFSLDNPAYEASTKVISAVTNAPLDRLFSKYNNLREAAAQDTEAWQSVAMILGWPAWMIKPDKEKEKKKEERKYKYKPLLTEEKYKQTTYKKLKQEEQVEKLKNLGLSNSEIKNLKYEKDRVNKIIELEKDKKDNKSTETKASSYKPSAKTKSPKPKYTPRQKDSIKYKKMKKPDQVRLLDSLGLSKKEIRALQYEKNRVAKLLDLMDNK